jgi:hypothetical protein
MADIFEYYPHIHRSCAFAHDFESWHFYRKHNLADTPLCSGKIGKKCLLGALGTQPEKNQNKKALQGNNFFQYVPDSGII